MPRGNIRGRGRGNFKVTVSRGDRESALDRLGGQANLYSRTINDRNVARRFKYQKPITITSSIAALPSELRIKAIVKKFVKTYYELFDQPGRPNLENQYSSEAFFSFSATYPLPTVGRNLLEVREPENRISLLVHDKGNITRALATFSPTEHPINNLNTDVPFYVANPMYITSLQLIVSGVFKDTSQTTDPLRAFTRVFALKLASIDKQNEPNYEIYNDLFMIQPPTPDQIKKYHQETQQIMKRLTTNQQQGRSNLPVTNFGTARLSRSRDESIQAIMARTRMNKAHSTKLLEENDWDESKSMEVFNELFTSNRIPQECFAP